MTAELTYQIISSLPLVEKERLFGMLEPEMKRFDLDELLSENASCKTSKEDMIKSLIKSHFSKVKTSSQSSQSSV